MKTKVITKKVVVLEKKDLVSIEKQLADKGTCLARWLYKNGYSCGYLHNLISNENNAEKFIKVLKAEGIKL